jgi:hypothetical protein
MVVPNALYGIDPSGFTFHKDIVGAVIRECHNHVFITLYAASNTLDVFAGTSSSPLVLQYQGAFIRYLNELISHPETRYSNDALRGVASALNIATVTGSADAFRTHLSGYKHLLRKRGGTISLRGHKVTDAFVACVTLNFCKRQLDTLIEVAVQCPEKAFEDICEFKESGDELIVFLEQLLLWREQSISASAAPLSAACSIKDQAEMLRSLLFGRDTFLRHLLRLHAKPAPFLRARQLEIEETCQIFCLLYFALVQWQYRDSPSQTAVYLERLDHRIRDAKLGSLKIRAPLAWFLVAGMDGGEFGWKWKAIRMIAPVWRLGQKYKPAVTSFLLDVLDPDMMNYPSNISFEDIKEVRREMLAGLPYV